jgi:hypothetical protein
MIIIVPVEKHSTTPHSNLTALDSHDLTLCPEKAADAAFLQLMDGWL